MFTEPFTIGHLYFSNLSATGQISLWIGIIICWLLLIYVHTLKVKASPYSKLDDHELDEIPETKNFSAEKRSTESNPRLPFIDCTRGLAISFVVYFHYIWNLRANRLMPRAPTDFETGHEKFQAVCEFWLFFGTCFLFLSELFAASIFAGYLGFVYVTAVCINWHYWSAQASGVGMIMFCVGMSSYIQNRNGMKWDKIFSRIKLLAIVAACISAVTYIIFNDRFVYFGAIHCIALVSVLHIPFLFKPEWAIFGTIFVVLHKAFFGDFFLEAPLHSTVDYMPWFGNFGYVCLGIFCGHIGLYRAKRYVRCLWGMGQPGMALEDCVFPYLGQHSLFIFIAHQVVLFPLVKFAAFFI